MANQSDFSANKLSSAAQNIMIIDSPNGKFRAIANFQEQTINVFAVGVASWSGIP